MRIKNLLKTAALLASIFVCRVSYGQNSELTYSIIFGLDSDKVDLGIADNRTNIDNLLDHMREISQDTTKVVSMIEIDSYASPDGGAKYNKELAVRRSESFYNYISKRTLFSRDLYNIKGTGINWELLIELVEQSDMDYKGEVLNILKYTPEETWVQKPGNKWKTLVDSRNKQLMDLKGGVPYKYMKAKFFPQLRVGSAISVYYEQKYHKTDTVVVERVDTVYKVKEEPVMVAVPSAKRVPMFALKTNLLADVIFIPNVELEVPIGDRFSINGEFSRMWATDGSKVDDWCNQLQSYGVEARYWFSDREKMNRLSGFFGGLYYSATTLDLQRYSAYGNQIDVKRSFGVTGGYSMPLSKTFNLEFSAGIGYINGTSDKYKINADGYLIRESETKEFSKIFPTKAKVSLVWLINKTKK